MTEESFEEIRERLPVVRWRRPSSHFKVWRRARLGYGISRSTVAPAFVAAQLLLGRGSETAVRYRYIRP